MTNYKTILLTGTLTKELKREFRVPDWVTEEDFNKAIDEGWLQTEEYDAEDDCIWDLQSQDWDLDSPTELNYDAGGEEHEDVFPLSETVRAEIDFLETRTVFLEVPPNTTVAAVTKLLLRMDPSLFKLKDTSLKWSKNFDDKNGDIASINNVTFSRDFEPGQKLSEEEQDQLLEWSKDES